VLASYTVDGDGNISTTNPGNEAPSPAVGPTMMKISPSGNLLAVAGGKTLIAPISVSIAGNGLQIFHFNGPDPITPYSNVLTSDSIDQMQWDNNDHLFALSDSTHKLYVYTLTPTSITAAPGSPYTIASANALVVVPTSSCSAPTSAGVHICSPASGASISSPVLVTATSKVTGTIVSTQLWVDGVKNFNAPGSTTLTTSVSLAAGSHRFAVIATNTSGQKWESTVTATVE
jgi:Bacterial Ig domain